MKDIDHIILGVHISNRTKHVSKVQDLLTAYGCNIKTRLGMHLVSQDLCSPNGLIILEMAGKNAIAYELVDKLNAIEGVDCQKMAFKVPVDQVLTESQAEFISKIGSIKNLMSLDFIKKLNLPKADQISTFDYCLKVLRSMGIDPTVLFNAFLTNFFDTDRLVHFILLGFSQILTANNILLDSNSS